MTMNRIYVQTGLSLSAKPRKINVLVHLCHLIFVYAKRNMVRSCNTAFDESSKQGFTENALLQDLTLFFHGVIQVRGLMQAKTLYCLLFCSIKIPSRA
jgi:hypothetical protein